mmetsp:Transcript_22928/g.66288  ORF Transcript_22928/g.66288 Transcript_22928/m.66288 type:complete len:266 (+) Transcript_22928:426-1223(+)
MAIVGGAGVVIAELCQHTSAFCGQLPFAGASPGLPSGTGQGSGHSSAKAVPSSSQVRMIRMGSWKSESRRSCTQDAMRFACFDFVAKTTMHRGRLLASSANASTQGFNSRPSVSNTYCFFGATSNHALNVCAFLRHSSSKPQRSPMLAISCLVACSSDLWQRSWHQSNCFGACRLRTIRDGAARREHEEVLASGEIEQQSEMPSSAMEAASKSGKTVEEQDGLQDPAKSHVDPCTCSQISAIFEARALDRPTDEAEDGGFGRTSA